MAHWCAIVSLIEDAAARPLVAHRVGWRGAATGLELR